MLHKDIEMHKIANLTLISFKILQQLTQLKIFNLAMSLQEKFSNHQIVKSTHN